MRREERNIASQSKSTLQKIEQLHPHQMLLFLGIFGIVIVFFFLLIAFFLSVPPDFGPGTAKFPKSFYLSCLVLLASSWLIHRTLPAYDAESLGKICNYLALTLFLGLIFCVFQVKGWTELRETGIYFQGNATSAYLYLISGLHGAHLIGGMVFLVIIYLQLKKKNKDAVETLIVVTNPYERLKLKMLAIYWHFMDFLWLVLFFSFLLVY